jgi:small subunit ribosomal protein S17
MAENPEETQETAPTEAADQTPPEPEALDEAAAAEAEVTASDDAPIDDAAALEASDEPEGAADEAPAAPAKAAAPQRPQRTPEERQAERQAERARKAGQRRRFRARAKTRRAEQRTVAPAPEADHAPEHGPGRPKTRQGVVISAKPDKTISVRIDVARRHPRYHKIMRTSSTLHVHDERNDANEGDTVRVVECRPLSRSKRWRLVEILERAR